MNKFGITKCKVLSKLTEAYASGDKETIKNIINIIKENKDFKELYLLYEDIENKYFSDKQVAESYVVELGRSLNGKINNVKDTLNKLEEMIGNVETKYQSTYDTLDYLLQEDNLMNIETKVRAKIDLCKHLTEKKEIKESTIGNYTTNESLLYSVLTNNFNDTFSNSLNENEKKELNEILGMTDEEISSKTKELKENITSKINSLLFESTDNDFKEKLHNTKSEVASTAPSKYNYFKLKELYNGINQ